MKIVLIGTLDALETFNQIYKPETKVIDIIKDLHKAEELKKIYNKIIERCIQ